MPTGLLLLAPGSPDPRHAQTLHAVADDVRGDVEAHVALGFLDHDAPTVAEAVTELSLDNHRVVAVHLRLTCDAPEQKRVADALAHAPAHRPVVDAGPLQLGPWLIPLLERRAGAAGAAAGEDVTVLLVADPGAVTAAAEVATQWSALRRSPVRTVTLGETDGHGSALGATLDGLGSHGQRVVVVPLALEPDSAYDLAVTECRARGVAVADVLAPAQEVTDRIVALARGQVVLPDVSVPA